MQTQLTEIPSPKDAHEFYEVVEKAIMDIPRRKFLHGDVNNTEIIFSHKFYKWVADTPNFQRVLNHLTKKKLMSKDSEAGKVIISKCVAIVYPRYCMYIENPNWIKVTTKATKNKAIKNIDELLTLLATDLKMEDYEDDLNLKKLLIKIKTELNNESPTTYPRSRRKDLSEQQLVIDIYETLHESIGEAPPFIILQLASIMYEKLDAQKVRRHLKEVKVKYKQSTKPSN